MFPTSNTNTVNRDIASSEQAWKRDEAFRDRASRRREEADMQDVELVHSTPEEEAAFQSARAEAAQANAFPPVMCDGSGVIDEWYTDVDQTQVVRCEGCPACDVPAKPEVEYIDSPMPEWMMEPAEPVEFVGAAKLKRSMGRETRENETRKVA